MSRSYYAIDSVSTGCCGANAERGNYMGKEIVFINCSYKTKKGKCAAPEMEDNCIYNRLSPEELRQKFFPRKSDNISSLLELD
jgi:hypothetical protein